MTKLLDFHAAGQLQFFGAHSGLSDQRTFKRHLAQVRRKTWVVYAKPPFSSPGAVLTYLSRYTHRVAISNRRLISFDEAGVAFRYKDYRRTGDARYRLMTLHADESVRRFLLHVLPTGFHRIRHYGLLASAGRKANVARARELLTVTMTAEPATSDEPADPSSVCPCCGERMIIIDIFEPTFRARGPPGTSFPAGMKAS